MTSATATTTAATASEETPMFTTKDAVKAANTPKTLSYCEGVSASGLSPWHLRVLTCKACLAASPS